jgi:hypothetical protein
VKKEEIKRAGVCTLINKYKRRWAMVMCFFLLQSAPALQYQSLIDGNSPVI